MERIDRGYDMNVLDGAALVMGSAVASVHILRIIRGGLSGTGWVMVAMTFAGIAITTSGPFVYLSRRYARRLPGYPRVGDWLWTILGLPWLVTAILQSAVSRTEPGHDPLFASLLAVGLFIACGTALAVVWGAWVVVPPEQAARVEAAPWTNRVGLILAVAWPIQCGMGMMVLS